MTLKRRINRWYKTCGIAVLMIIGSYAVQAQSWTYLGPPDCQLIACSADGKILVTEGINVSTNSGETWTPTPWNSGLLYAVACSAGGNTIFATSQRSDNLYISTNFGQTWMTNTSASGYSVACSADGTRVCVAGLLYSTNSGMTFTTNDLPGTDSRGYESIVMSSDGTKIIGTLDSIWTSDYIHSPIYRSTDSGVTWTRTSAPVIFWTSLASSPDGTHLAAVDLESGAVWISTNSGEAWSSNFVGYSSPSIIASSADGTRLVAFGTTGPVISLNSGQSWSFEKMVSGWEGVCMSADGSFVAASAGGIYVTHIPAQPSLSIIPSGPNLVLSWPLPSAGFVLQQSSSLKSTNWFNVTNAVVASGYYNQVTLAPSVMGNAYYRLTGP
ncbi:MAG TPA: hypothetical protein VH595_18440 [Verrucomicrobiae bacterium]|jgi:hypothetical protein|nr:hypothetical protein [Verrucomicrobiae bacterium]